MAQSETHRRAAFGRASAMIQRLGDTLLVALILGLAAYVAAIAWELNTGATGGAAVHIDFVAFWAAAKLAVAGEAVSAFDPPTLIAAQSLAPDSAWDTYSWHYPPAFHLLVAPLGLLGFSPAFAVFSALTIGLYLWALSGWAGPVPGGLGLAAAAPPAAFVLVTGNASLLWAAALLAALSCLTRGRAVAAGAMIALLTLKPQLGLMIPVALIAGRYWGVMLWAALATLAIAALPVTVFGLEYWQVFFQTMGRTTDIYAIHGKNAVTMITWYATARQFGGAHEVAIVVQMLALAGAAVAVGVVWSRRQAPMDLKIAALCLATLIATPYAFQYELVLAVLAALFLARAGIGATMTGRAWLAALWLLPVPGWLIGGLEIAHYAAPVLSLSLAFCLIAVFGGVPRAASSVP